MLFQASILSNSARILPYNEILSLAISDDKENSATGSNPDDKESRLLLDIAALSHGLSGRTLRKMPFLAHAWFIRTEQAEVGQYMEALKLSVLKHLDDSQSIANK